MKYDLFISDYDGTLGIAPKNDIDPETLSAINKYIEKSWRLLYHNSVCTKYKVRGAI